MPFWSVPFVLPVVVFSDASAEACAAFIQGVDIVLFVDPKIPLRWVKYDFVLLFHFIIIIIFLYFFFYFLLVFIFVLNLNVFFFNFQLVLL